MKLSKRYVIGTHVMWFEIEMYKDFLDGLENLLKNIDLLLSKSYVNKYQFVFVYSILFWVYFH